MGSPLWIYLAALLVSWLLLPQPAAATEFDSADYYLYAGDFNGDGKTDLLYIGKTPDKPSGIALADANGVPQMGFQSWPSDYLNIPWSGGAYEAVIGDFNGDGCSDILLQAQTPGTSYVLLANCNSADGPVGQITGISQAIPESYLGISWSADQHRIVAGDFDGDGKTDLFLQATAPGGTTAIVLADAGGNLFTRTSGNCWSSGPQQCWSDGYQGFNWSTKAATVYVGDFNGDHKSDLLIISNPTLVVINFSVPFPVPQFAANSDGILLAQPIDSGGTIFRSVNQLWNYNGLGANFSPLVGNVVVGDFNGDGYSDVLIQSKDTGRSNLLLYSNSNGQLGTATTPASLVAGWAASSYTMLMGNFGNSATPVLYLQAASAGGGSYFTSNISQSSVTATPSTIEIAANATSPANGVGATAGTAEVTPNGTGRYSIPLTLPRGTAGLTPELALQYQNSTPNGLLGVGWGISGLSVITRCAETFAQDGITLGVQYLATDQYCLDGSRLRLTSGSQGADGSQYRTELETFSLIIAHGAGTNGPQWFEIRHKNGQIYEYGNTSDSLIPGYNGTRVWALNKIRDRAGGLSGGNYITFSYINDTAHGSYRPNQIAYAGNSTQGTAPPYAIQFSYQGRNSGENLTRYYVGQQITELNRLSQIQLQYGPTVVRTWTLGYDTTVTPTHASRITSIQECGENSDCFPATTFTWSTQAFTGNAPMVAKSNVSDPLSINYSGTTSARVWQLDIDGDGVPDDIVWIGPPTSTLALVWGTPKGQTQRATVPFSGVLVSGYNYGSGFAIPGYDVLSEGKQPFFLAGNCQGQQQDCWIHVPSGATTPSVDPIPGGWASPSGDFNGDGFPDELVIVDSIHMSVALHNLNGATGFQALQPAWTTPSGVTFAAQPTALPVPVERAVTGADFDGDGRQDLLVQTSNGWQVLYSNGSGFTAGDLIVPMAAVVGYYPPIMIDINGDGCTDLVYPSSTANSAGYNTWIVRVSKCGMFGGSGFAPPVDTGLPAASSTYGKYPALGAADLNGDGFQDLIYTDPTSSTSAVLVAYSTGTGFAAPVPLGNAADGTTLAPYWIDQDGDGLPDNIVAGGFYSAAGPKSDLMLSATDGFGNAVSFTFAPLTDPTVYTRGQGQMGVTQDMSGPMYVVKQVQSTDGVGGHYTQTYTYTGAHRNVQGRGFLGFATRTIADSRTGVVTTESYNNTTDASGNGWELTGKLTEQKIQQWAGGPVLSDIVNTWASMAPDNATNRHYPYIQSQTAKSYELNNSGTPITTKIIKTTIDNYGTPYDVVVTTTESSTGINAGSSRTQETYTAPSNVLNDTTNWCLSRPLSTQVKSSHTLASGSQLIQSITQAWDAPHCRITDRNLDVGSSWEADVHYDYDGWNNVSDQVVKASNLPQSSRTTSYDYQTGAAVPGQLLMGAKNALGQTTKYGWDNARALKTSQTDPNGFAALWFYDDFGRLVRELRPDGTGSRRTYSPCNAGTNYCGDSLLRYMVQVDERDVSDNIITYQYLFYDGLGRAKYDEALGFSGALSVVESLYDPVGNLVSRSNPYYAGTDRYQGASFSYDLYHRLVSSEQPTSDGNSQLATTNITYNGLTVTVTDALGHGHTQVSDAWGDVLRTIDAAGSNANYTFDAFSHLTSTTDASGNSTSLTYTDRGFKLTSSDPDMGAWSYSYDGLGEMLTQTDAKSQVTQFHYDARGRMDTRTDPGASSPDTIWSWDSAAHGIGLLGSVSGTNGYSEQYAYGASGTATGKLTGTQTTAAGATYSVSYGFDPARGALQTITYPASTSGQLEVFYDYQNGYLKDVKDYTNQVPGTVYWQAIAQDARGHVIQEQYGNGEQTYLYFDETSGRLNSLQTGPGGGTATQDLNYTWDAIGNLLSRQDGNQSLSESFGYDVVNRLQSVSLNGNATLSMSYDAIGNISSKSDVGTYNYTTQQSACAYTGLPAQPHAVRNAAGTAYCYDADGNMTSRGGAAVTWYPYNLPQSINQAGGNSSTFYYAPDRSRYRQVSLNGSTSEDRTYVAGLFEKLTSSSAGVEYRHYIIANGQTVAMRVISASRNDTLYLHTDHLGSTDTITNQSGSVLIHESYDAWGKRRGSNWTGTPSASDTSTIATSTHVGFTAQEEIDNLGLVNLNGRVYDPTLARFLSADPYVQAPYDLQSLNRYSYTFDNPLNAIDPTGFDGCTGSNIADAGADSAACAYSNQPGSGYLNGMQFDPQQPIPGVSVTATYIDAQSGSAQQDPNSLNLEQQQASQGPGAQQGADQGGDASLPSVTVKSFWEPPSLWIVTQMAFSSLLQSQSQSRSLWSTLWSRFTAQSPLVMIGMVAALVVAPEGPGEAADLAILLGDSAELLESLTALPEGAFGLGVDSAAEGATVFAGHGVESALAGTTIVPEGVALTLPGAAGLELPDALGQLIEAGDWQAIGANPRWANLMSGSTTYLPGSEVPNLILQAPTGLSTLPGSITVTGDTSLSTLLNGARGLCVWAACRLGP